MSAADSASPWTARVVTLYPEMFPGPLGVSLARRVGFDIGGAQSVEEFIGAAKIWQDGYNLDP